VGLGLLLLAGCGGGSKDEHGEDDHEGEHPGEHVEGVVHLEPPKLERAGIKTATVEVRPLAAQLETTGEVDYDENSLAHVSPRITGRVHRVAAQLGDRVAAGSVLALLDSIELGQAKAAYLTAKATEDVARQNHEREEGLFKDRISSEKEMLEARGAFLEAAASRESAEETLHLYGLTDTEIAAFGPGESGASLLSVRAPFGGRVVEKHVTIGELVTPEKNLFTIADLDQVWIWIDVYERDLGRVHMDDGVAVEVVAYPGRTFTGTVTYIGANVAPDTRKTRARLVVKNPDGLLRPGMFARVQLSDPHAQGAASALVVPESAVHRDGTESIVFVPLGEGRFARREIEAGRHEGPWVEVLSGLKSGEAVVTAGVFLLKSELARGELGGGHSH
jgi:cobalt-zinc-cadmium efflux system membrane fusion protein